MCMHTHTISVVSQHHCVNLLLLFFKIILSVADTSLLWHFHLGRSNWFQKAENLIWNHVHITVDRCHKMLKYHLPSGKTSVKIQKDEMWLTVWHTYILTTCCQIILKHLSMNGVRSPFGSPLARWHQIWKGVSLSSCPGKDLCSLTGKGSIKPKSLSLM